MNSNNILIREYLESLKEDSELDYLFPIMLNTMGFRIIQTAKESKGQSQYGKDIIAVGKDVNGINHRWYFELKGFKDKDITDKNYSTPDGIRDSIIEARDAAFKDSAIPGFNELPIKIVLIHNGTIKTNIRPTFEGFISREFPNGGFERWDIYFLTDLFAKYLFSEYLLSDNESTRLFKKTLAFLDMPEYEYGEFEQLVRLQFEKIGSVKGRALSKLFATLNILQSIIFHYSKENNNLIAAKECSKFLLLYTWAWILKNKFESKKAITREFEKLVRIQYKIFHDYFQKTLPVAIIENGLYAENGGFFEKVGYPLRCFEYLDDLIYFFRLRERFPLDNANPKRLHNLKNKQKDILIELISNNSGCLRPIIDRNSIPIMQVFLFFSEQQYLRQEDANFISSYIFQAIHNVLVAKLKHGLLPELYNNLNLVVEAVATGRKPDDYQDGSSVLLATLWELLVIFDSEEMYQERLHLPKGLSLQIASINFEEYDAEQLLFEKHLHGEYFVDCLEELPEEFEDFKKSVIDKIQPKHIYRTDLAGFAFLRYLAHSYYKNELLPEEWRSIINK